MSKELFPDLTVHHVAYSVRDLEEAVNFWTELFGFERDFDKQIPPIKAKLAFLKRDGFWLELFEVEDSKSPTKTQLKPNTDLAQQGTKHLCFSVDDPQAVLETLFEKGVEIAGVMRGQEASMQVEDDPRLAFGDTRDPAIAFFFLDPSQCLVEILRRSDFTA